MKDRDLLDYWQRNVVGQDGINHSALSAGRTDFCQSSGIHRGNFKDPLDWNYYIRHSIRHRTKVNGYHKWFSPPTVLQQKVTGSFGSQSGPLVIPNWERNGVYNQALDRLNEKVRGGLDLSISAFEAGQTKRMIKKLVQVIRHAKKTVRDSILRRRRVRKPVPGNRGLTPTGAGPGQSDVTHQLADGWLQFTYGWKPLLSDIFNIADETVRKTLHDIQRFRGRAYQPFMGPGVFVRTVDSFPYTPVRGEGDGKFGCMINIAFEPLLSDFDPARWSSLNPVSITWELIPYSFVVDWFVDVGSYLRNLETALLYRTNFRGGYVSELFIYDGVETVLNGTYRHPDNGDLHEFADVEGDLHIRRFIRTVLASYPFPRKPVITTDLSGNRLLSAASLLRQILRRV